MKVDANMAFFVAGQLGHLWGKRANGKGDVYRYDATDQLTNVLYEATHPDGTPGAWTNEVRYVFDAAGNRESVTRTNSGTTTYGANALNQYTNVGGVAVGWDANGNPTNVVENGVTLALTYDRENRLIMVNTGTVTVTNTYDAFHRLVERATAGGKLRFVYDNRWRVIAEYDQNDVLVNKYVYGPEIDEPVRLTRGAGRFYYHQAALGTVTELTGWLGHVRERYEYDVYGQPTLRNNVGTEIASSQFGNRFLFQGRDRDPDTGLYNFRYRTYSPTLGRFLQVDPIRERGGWNFYAFVNNAPVTKLDPLGLKADGYKECIDAAVATYDFCATECGVPALFLTGVGIVGAVAAPGVGLVLGGIMTISAAWVYNRCEKGCARTRDASIEECSKKKCR